MKDLSQWLEEYGESHQNPINQKIHKVAVPGIYLSIVGLFWSIPSITMFGISVNWVWPAAFPVLIFYLRLSLSVFLMMFGFTLACISLIWCLELMEIPIFTASLGFFIFLWCLQFIGHKIEGKKPSFIEDVQFLLIGPIWTFRQH